MAGVYVSSASGRDARVHYINTIERGLPLADVLAQITDEPCRETLQENSPDGRCYLWGAQNGNKNNSFYAGMKVGDLFLIYRDWALVASGYVIAKTVSADLGNFAWPGSETRPYDLVWFLEKPRFFNAPIARHQDYFGKTYQGLRRVSGSDRILKEFGTFEKFLTERLGAPTAPGAEAVVEPARPMLHRPQTPGAAFLALMRDYQQSGTVFASPVQQALYSIKEVNDTDCTVDRLTAEESERCTAEQFDRHLGHLEAHGGRCDFAQLQNTVAIRSAFLQADELGLLPDRQTVVRLPTPESALDNLCQWLQALRVDMSGGTPKLYKPVMMACVIEGIQAGELPDNRIEFDWVLPRFLAKMRTVGQMVTSQPAIYAFFHLTGDLLWMLCYRDPKAYFHDAPEITQAKIQERGCYARLKGAYWQVLKDKDNRTKALAALAQKWWPEAAQIILGTIGSPELPPQGETPMPITDRSMPQNLILYGPPGTGKTYIAIEKAVKICDGDAAPVGRQAIVTRYRQLREEGRIEFVTFHQSYSYEEFVEGICPIAPEEGASQARSPNGGIHFEVREGIFKKVCSLAREHRLTLKAGYDFEGAGAKIWKMSLGNTQDPGDDGIYQDCIENGYILLGYGSALDFIGDDTREQVHQKLQTAEPSIALGDYAVTVVNAFKNEMAMGDLVIVSDGNAKFRAIGKITGDYRFLHPEGYGQMRPVEWLAVFEDSVPRERLFRRSLSQRTLYRLRPEALKIDALRAILAVQQEAALKPYVLIIDEINRGNISKIMGELITLLESDKRLGQPNELTVRLPYSQEEAFGVPANLFIVATMNTADRSIAFMDTALRRRFVFEEMMPKYDVVRQMVESNGMVGGVDVAALLKSMNDRVEFLYDRDHRIGHSYFLGIKTLKDLRDVFVNQVIPLLQEYFYGDWSKLCMVLGCPYDAESASTTTKNPHPLVEATRLAAGDVPGFRNDDGEDRLRYEVHEEFAKATEDRLAAFFQGIIRQEA